jgi:isocitrate lyase
MIHEPVAAGEDDQAIGLNECGHLGGETVVVAEAQFLDGD